MGPVVHVYVWDLHGGSVQFRAECGCMHVFNAWLTLTVYASWSSRQSEGDLWPVPSHIILDTGIWVVMTVLSGEPSLSESVNELNWQYMSTDTYRISQTGALLRRNHSNKHTRSRFLATWTLTTHTQWVQYMGLSQNCSAMVFPVVLLSIWLLVFTFVLPQKGLCELLASTNEKPHHILYERRARTEGMWP